MKKYQVYLATKETIYIEADGFYINSDHVTVLFIKDDKNIAAFVFNNICGFEEVDEFDDEEDNNGQQ